MKLSTRLQPARPRRRAKCSGVAKLHNGRPLVRLNEVAILRSDCHLENQRPGYRGAACCSSWDSTGMPPESFFIFWIHALHCVRIRRVVCPRMGAIAANTLFFCAHGALSPREGNAHFTFRDRRMAAASAFMRERCFFDNTEVLFRTPRLERCEGAAVAYKRFEVIYGIELLGFLILVIKGYRRLHKFKTIVCLD